MLDIKLIRNETDRVKARLATRGANYDADIDAILQRDDARRALIFDTEQLGASKRSQPPNPRHEKGGAVHRCADGADGRDFGQNQGGRRQGYGA